MIMILKGRTKLQKIKRCRPFKVKAKTITNFRNAKSIYLASFLSILAELKPHPQHH